MPKFTITYSLHCHCLLVANAIGLLFSISGIAHSQNDAYWMAVGIASALANALLILYWAFRLAEYEKDVANA